MKVTFSIQHPVDEDYNELHLHMDKVRLSIGTLKDLQDLIWSLETIEAEVRNNHEDHNGELIQ